MEEWHEVSPFRSSLTAQLSQKAIYPPKVAVPQETTALVFDTTQELVWAGNRQVSPHPPKPEQRANGQGRVIGFAGPTLTSYTSFFAHVDEVRDLLVHDRGIISLGAKNVRVTHRRGLLRWDIKYPHNQPWRALI